MARPVRSNDYTKFDSLAYCKSFYEEVEVPGYPGAMQTILMNFLSEVYGKGEIKGSTLLDFGTGPVICNLISAAQYFPNIYLSDFSENNRSALWQWVSKQPESHDFSDFFKYVTKKEARREPWETLQEDMRSRIKGILACDMTKENPLCPCKFPEFDVISSSQCLSIVPGGTLKDYKAAVRHVVSLLKPGGCVVYFDVAGTTWYLIDECKYTVLPLTKEDVIHAWKEAGCEPKSWMSFNRSDSEIKNWLLDDSKGFFCMTAQKIKQD